MRILITAGGTSEPIDNVRAITNHSTGRLGQTIANLMLETGWQVDYITTKQALLPENSPSLTKHFIASTQDLLATITELLTKHRYDAVIHSMAVSDFTGETAFSEEKLIENFLQLKPELTKEGLHEFFQQLAQQKNTETKISSDTDRLILTLKKTPKVIQQIKKLQPDTMLFGFKLLVDVSKEELLTVAQAALEKNQADFVLANDLTEISGDQHHGYLLAKDGSLEEATTKSEIATLILDKIMQQEDAQ